MIVCGASPGIGAREKTDPKGDILLSDDGGESWRVTTNGLERYALGAAAASHRCRKLKVRSSWASLPFSILAHLCLRKMLFRSVLHSGVR